MEFTVPRNPEQNGISERLNRTILDMARCLIFDSGLSKDMWGEAVLTAIYTINRNPTSTLSNGKIPAEIWYGHKVDLTKMRVFGCTAYNHIPKVDRTKLDKRSKMLIMIGYAPNGYRLWDPILKKIVIARNVIFDESPATDHKISTDRSIVNRSMLEIESDPIENIQNTQDEDKSPREVQNASDQTLEMRSTRQRQSPAYLQNYHLNLMEALLIETDDTPKDYNEAIMQGNGWREAIEDELDALNKNETWELIPKLDDIEIIDSKWVFREKEIQGAKAKKARLVARGFLQEGINKEDTLLLPEWPLCEYCYL